MEKLGVLFVLAIYITQFVMTEDKVWRDYRKAAPLSVVQKRGYSPGSVTCKGPGLTCGTDCVSVYLCIETDTGLRPTLSETCHGGTSCSAGKCSTVPSHECSSGALFPFVCNSIDGVYPDPADCRRYHYCVPNPYRPRNLTHYNATCDWGYAYNPVTTHCDTYIAGRDCGGYTVPVCEKPAQTGALVANSSLYYICLPYTANTEVLYPFLYLCEHGKNYTGQYTCK